MADRSNWVVAFATVAGLLGSFCGVAIEKAFAAGGKDAQVQEDHVKIQQVEADQHQDHDTITKQGEDLKFIRRAIEKHWGSQ